MASAHGTGDHIISVQPEANGLSHVQPDYGWAVPLIKAMERGDWACFKTQLDLDSSVKSRRINSRGDTFLHLAIRDTGNVQFVRELVKEMSQEELELKNEMEGHALISAATGGIKEIAEIMLEKNNNLAGIPSGNGLLPIIIAVRNGDKDIAEYLYSKTPLEQLDPEKMENGSRVVTDGARLVRAAIISDMYGIALKLVQQYPKLAIACEDRRWNAAIILAGRPCAFPSGCRHQFLEGLVYKGVSLLSGIQQETDSGSHGNKAQLSRMNQVMNVLRGFFWKGIKHISGVQVKKEAPVNFLTDPTESRSSLRPIDILVYNWSEGRHACVDITEVSVMVGFGNRIFLKYVKQQTVQRQQKRRNTVERARKTNMISYHLPSTRLGS